MKFFTLLMGPLLFFSSLLQADEGVPLEDRIKRLERLITEQRWACSIRCYVNSKDSKYFWSRTKAGSGEDPSKVFTDLAKQCDEYHEWLKNWYKEKEEEEEKSYTFQGVKLDRDGAASVRRNCIKVNKEKQKLK